MRIGWHNPDCPMCGQDVDRGVPVPADEPPTRFELHPCGHVLDDPAVVTAYAEAKMALIRANPMEMRTRASVPDRVAGRVFKQLGGGEQRSVFGERI